MWGTAAKTKMDELKTLLVHLFIGVLEAVSEMAGREQCKYFLFLPYAGVI